MADELVRLDALQAALAKAEDIQEVGLIRAQMEVIAKVLAPRSVAGRYKGAKGYLDACRTHGEWWDKTENKRPVGNPQLQKNLQLDTIDYGMAGFKHRMDASQCLAVADPEFDVEYEQYAKECKDAGKYPTLNGAYQIWKMLNPAEIDMPPLPQGKYRSIVIDPPWPVQKILREARDGQDNSLDYTTLTLEEIAELPIADLADEEGCHIYLWATHKQLPSALDCFESWGVNYQCLMTWVKNTGMTPFTWMYNTEHILFGRIGNLPLEQNGIKLSFEGRVTRHSEKPGTFYDIVKLASPGPRIDMFARTQHSGFESWGLEAPAVLST